MKQLLWVAIATALVMLATECAAEAQEVTQIPNILFILTDDQDEESIARMDTLQSDLVAQGTRFENAFVTTPQCCPSRVTFLRGQYAHNHQILSNNPPLGGFERFRNSTHERSTIATWLDEANYDTAYTGKYLNGYGEKKPTPYVPPGWDRWWAREGGIGHESYSINENGHLKTIDYDNLHDTDYYSRRANEFIRDHERDADPWFMVVAPTAPHSPAYFAKRHAGMFRKVEMPKPPSFNEQDVSDKPLWVRKQPRLKARGIRHQEQHWRKVQRSLQSVDDLVGEAVDVLAATDQLDNTYVVYASDNGFQFYRHRIKKKGAPYEESIGIPFIVRGPGVPQGEVRTQLVANTDWAPTIAAWAGVKPPDFIDGRSFAPLLSHNPPDDWRERLVIEFFKKEHRFYGLRTADGETYVEYPITGEKEYYELANDPWQLTSAQLAAENTERIEALSKALSELQHCSATKSISCQEQEDASLPTAFVNDGPQER
jgi:N-acetylglucosamine-6-sulfatase